MVAVVNELHQTTTPVSHHRASHRTGSAATAGKPLVASPLCLQTLSSPPFRYCPARSEHPAPEELSHSISES